ncbi:MAG: hypothetical protein V4543_13030 [Bacteroidota bacterium]
MNKNTGSMAVADRIINIIDMYKLPVCVFDQLFSLKREIRLGNFANFESVNMIDYQNFVLDGIEQILNDINVIIKINYDTCSSFDLEKYKQNISYKKIKTLILNLNTASCALNLASDEKWGMWKQWERDGKFCELATTNNNLVFCTFDKFLEKFRVMYYK